MTKRAWAITEATDWRVCPVCSPPTEQLRRHDNGVCMYDPRSELCRLITKELRAFESTKAAKAGLRCLEAHAGVLFA